MSSTVITPTSRRGLARCTTGRRGASPRRRSAVSREWSGCTTGRGVVRPHAPGSQIPFALVHEELQSFRAGHRHARESKRSSKSRDRFSWPVVFERLIAVREPLGREPALFRLAGLRHARGQTERRDERQRHPDENGRLRLGCTHGVRVGTPHGAHSTAGGRMRCTHAEE